LETFVSLGKGVTTLLGTTKADPSSP